MTRRSRVIAFGSAAALVLAGGVCAVVVSGLLGEVLTIVLVSVGLGGALLLVFLEVGLSEEREIERERRRRREQAVVRRRLQPRRWPRRLR